MLNDILRGDHGTCPDKHGEPVKRCVDTMLLTTLEPFAGPPVDPRSTGGEVRIAMTHSFFHDGHYQNVAAHHVLVADQIRQFIGRKLVPERTHHRLTGTLVLTKKRVEIRKKSIA